MLLKNNKKTKIKNIIKIFLIILILSLLIGLVYFVFYSDFLKVKNFKFNYSNNYLGSDKISGFFGNDFLISSLTAEIIKERKILGYLGSDNILFWLWGKNFNLVNNYSLPSVKNIDIQIDFSERLINLSIDEKKLFGIYCLNEDKCFAFDENGVSFAKAPNSKGFLILKINDKNSRLVMLGDNILPKKGWFNNIIESVKIIEDAGLNIKSIYINDLKFEEWEIEVMEGPIFIFSLNFVPDDLYEVVKTLIDKTNFSKTDYFDMRVENRIYYNKN
jgi:hypothetical protein